MSPASNQDPKLLYAIDGVKAFHVANGSEQPLTPSGPQTLSLLMVPTSSGFSDVSGPGTGGEEDFYLHLHLPPELDLPLPATTQIYHQPPNGYLIPRWDLGPNSGAFTRLEFPMPGSRAGLREDVDTFETILAQCTAFLERANPPAPPPPPPPPPPIAMPTGSPGGSKSPSPKAGSIKSPRSPRSPPPGSGSGSGSKAREAAGERLPTYNPSHFDPGEGYVQGSRSSNMGGRIVLIDEEDGSVIGELSEGYQVVEDHAVKPGSKEPVEISLPVDGSDHIAVQPAYDYIEEEEASLHPAYKKSTIVNTAQKASRLLITTTDYVSKVLQSQADNFAKSTKPAAQPMTFTPATHAHIRRINNISSRAVELSASTIGSINSFAQNFGAAVGRRKDGRARGFDAQGNVIETYKPGVLNKSLMAFHTVMDGVEQAGKSLLTNTTSSVSSMVEHRWGAEAGQVSRDLGGGFKNVGLVYIDVSGVSRRAILKSVAKGMVVGRVRGGGQVIVGGNEDGNGNGNRGNGSGNGDGNGNGNGNGKRGNGQSSKS